MQTKVVLKTFRLIVDNFSDKCSKVLFFFTLAKTFHKPLKINYDEKEKNALAHGGRDDAVGREVPEK